MKAFSNLLTNLILTSSRNRKISLLVEYFNEDGDGLYPMTIQIVGKGSLYDPNNERVRS